MAILRTTHLYEFLARVSTAPENGGRLVGMHVTHLERFSEGAEVLSERLMPAQPIDFAGLVALMHPDDIAALIAAVQG